jgi:mannose-6-phosphate isomerase-like protein (cupin superfamily)
MDRTSRAWWSLDTLVVEHQVGDEAAPVVLEQTLPVGAAPPQHRHHRYDDNWYLLDGTVVVRCGGEGFVARPGSFVRTPAGTLHQFRVVGDRPARMLLVHANHDFYNFLRALAVPAERLALPAPTGGPGIERLTAAATEHDTEIVGASMTEEEATAILTATDG